ncbi:hypothetical protein KM043_008343 [Ampulex compressa]|nr:hypothetical protein KM043_008343 [Ampulex compressa]
MAHVAASLSAGPVLHHRCADTVESVRGKEGTGGAEGAGEGRERPRERRTEVERRLHRLPRILGKCAAGLQGGPDGSPRDKQRHGQRASHHIPLPRIPSWRTESSPHPPSLSLDVITA